MIKVIKFKDIEVTIINYLIYHIQYKDYVFNLYLCLPNLVFKLDRINITLITDFEISKYRIIFILLGFGFTLKFGKYTNLAIEFRTGNSGIIRNLYKDKDITNYFHSLDEAIEIINKYENNSI